MAKITKGQAENQHSKRQKNFKKKDFEKIMEEGENLNAKFKKEGKLKKYYEEFKLLFSLVKDYVNGSYREVPWNILASIGGTLLYVLSPVDLIPDFIPLVGYVDDAAVFAFCLNFIEKDLEAYRSWKLNNQQ